MNDNIMSTTQTLTYDININKKKYFNILIIDDDINITKLFKEYLESRGHNVHIVDEGTRGIMQFNDKQFDIIFVDYHLKDGSPTIHNSPTYKSYVDGTIITECIQNIMQNKEATKSSLIFAYTGDSSKSAINKFKKVGMAGALFKPVDIIILNKLMNLLETNTINSSQILHQTKNKFNSNSLIVF